MRLKTRPTQQPARQVDRPQPGWFKLRLVRKGPIVPAEITHGPTADPETGRPLDRSWYYAAAINGEPDPAPSPSPSDRVLFVWTSGWPISPTDYVRLLADRRWAAQYAPRSPEAKPRAPVNRWSIDPNTLF